MAFTHLLLRVPLLRHSNFTGQFGQICYPNESIVEENGLLLYRKPLGRIYSPGAHRSLLREWCQRGRTLKIQWRNGRYALACLLASHNNITSVAVSTLSDGVWQGRLSHYGTNTRKTAINKQRSYLFPSHYMGGRSVLAAAASCLVRLAVRGANLPYVSL